MPKRFDEPEPNPDEWEMQRRKLLGFGDTSMRKSYYPELQERLADLERFRTLLDQSNDAVFLVRVPTGKLVDFSESACRQLGLSRQALAGRSLDDLIVLEQSLTFQDLLLAEWLETRRPDDRQARLNAELICASQAHIPVELTIRLVDFQDNPYGVVVARDITERKRSEEAVRTYAAQLERSNRDLQDFASIASHDLQEPLRKIRAFGQRLKDRAAAKLDENEREYLSRMVSASERMEAMIQDLLSYSRVSTQTQPFHRVDLNQEALAAIEDLELRLERSQGQVVLGDLPVIEADPSQMRQLFQNLIGNALKFHQPGLPPVVQVTSRPTSPEEMQAPGVQILVADNGIGFDSHHLERIFQPFERLHGKADYEGTGMGLAICRKIIQRHHGTITATSQPGQGTAFLINLPLRQSEDANFTYPHPAGFSAQPVDLLALEAEEPAGPGPARQAEVKERYQAHLLESAQDAILATDAQLRLTYWNRGAEAMYGWSASEALGRPYFGRIETVFEPEELTGLLKALKEQGHYRHVLHQFSRSEKELYVEAHILALKSEAGEITGYLFVNRDITEHRRLEASLRENEERMRMITENIPAQLLQTDLTGRIIYINRTASGIPAEQVLGTNLMDWVEPDGQATIQNALEATRTTGQPQSYEVVGTGPFGEMRYYSSRMSPVIIDGTIDSIILIISDITERIATESALLESEERFRKLMEESPFGIAIYDPDGTIIQVNKAWEQIWGLSAQAVVGRYNLWQDRILQELGHVPLLKKAFAGEPVQIPDIDYDPARNGFVGQRRWIRTQPYVIRKQDGQVSSLVIGIEDITARKEAEAVINQLNASLEQRVQERTAQLLAANQELEAFAYSISHDLRAPLRGIDGFSLALLEDHQDELSPGAQHYLARIRSATSRMSQLIDGMLDLSRLSRGELVRAQVDLSDLASTIAATLMQREPNRQVTWEIQPGLRLEADSRLIGSAMENLIGNAFKFTSKTPQARIEVGAVDRQGSQVFFVKDNGIGFDMAFVDKLFGPFQRLHTEDDFPGNGIGLAITQRIFQLHGGRVWAESTPGQGATFFFTLP